MCNDARDDGIQKVSADAAPLGPMGQRYLAVGTTLAMRLWHEPGPLEGVETERLYETVGFVIEGRAELTVEGRTVLLEPGDSWLVPQGARHAYRILERFTAVEATSPPAQERGRDRLNAAHASGTGRASH